MTTTTTTLVANLLRVEDATAQPGEGGVMLPVSLGNDVPLTLVQFEVAFDTALCSALEDPDGITVEGTTRALRPVQEQPVTCTSGVIPVVILDLLGADVVAAGSGPLVQIKLGDIRADASARSFGFTLQNVTARRGPVTVPLATTDGTLTVS